MKLHNRIVVEGTTPTIYIGHRGFKDRRSGHVKTCKKWHAEYNYHGRKYDEPLGTANRTAAIKAAFAVVQRIERGEQRHAERVQWQEMWDAYMQVLRHKGRAPKTIQKYEFVLKRFMDFAKERKRHRPDAVTPSDFWAFNDRMATDELHDKTKADRLTIVKQWFKWAVVKAKPPMMSVNPLAGEEIQEVDPTPQPCFTPEQVAKLLASADKDHEGPVYAVMAYLGLRFGEVRDLKWSDFDFGHGRHGWVVIQRGGSNGRTKGRATRRIPVNEELRRILDRLPRQEGGRVFYQRASSYFPNGDNPLDERRLLTSLKRLCRRCGFTDPDQYKLHTFRHAFASMLARRNVSYKQSLAFMGHRDSQILDLYISLFDGDAEAAIQTVTYPTSAQNLAAQSATV